MCGIVGVIDWKRSTTSDHIDEMLTTLHHRGPDDSGKSQLSLSNTDVWLGHSRLSIIDLSLAGHQPMKFGDWVIVFNGEIYNYKSIRESLINSGHHFESQSDTEVVLHAFQEWGEGCVHHFRGMFAFAILNKSREELFLFRDRVGVKPLYYFISSNCILFASELKSLVIHPEFKKNIDPISVHSFLQRGYISAPRSIYQDASKLLPGSFLKVNLTNRNTTVRTYWSALDFYKLPKLSLDFYEAKELLKDKLIESSLLRMVSDVPVGIFLSGGYDSTAITAALRQSECSSLKTFTIGFDQGVNEAPFAKKIAEFLQTDHIEYYCTQDQAKLIIPDLPIYFDEPFADSSAIPTILVSRIAREHVTVALSADGGDELFAGYERYRSFNGYMKFLAPFQKGVLNFFAKKFLNGTLDLIPRSNYSLRHKVKEFRTALQNNANNIPKLFLGMGAISDDYLEEVLVSKKEIDLRNNLYWLHELNELNFLDAAMIADINTYLVEDILTKVDRATMSSSLEGREPLLDHTLIEFAAQLPVEYKFDGITTKKILKQVVHDWVPAELVNRPKAGFSLPINAWLRGDLKYLLDHYLSSSALSASGVFQVDFILKQRKLFESGKLHYSIIVWRVLMFQMWYEKWISK